MPCRAIYPPQFQNSLPGPARVSAGSSQIQPLLLSRARKGQQEKIVYSCSGLGTGMVMEPSSNLSAWEGWALDQPVSLPMVEQPHHVGSTCSTGPAHSVP